MNQYEIMFLFDPMAGSDWAAVEKEIDRVMQRAKAEVILTKRLEERKLAYEVEGRKRGLYVLTYFRAPPESITPLERDCRLSEMILRVLILQANEITEEKMRAATLAGVGDGRRTDGPGGDRRDRHGDRRDDEDFDHRSDVELVGSSAEEAPHRQP